MNTMSVLVEINNDQTTARLLNYFGRWLGGLFAIRIVRDLDITKVGNIIPTDERSTCDSIDENGADEV